jgi:hypothetical protein
MGCTERKSDGKPVATVATISEGANVSGTGAPAQGSPAANPTGGDAQRKANEVKRVEAIGVATMKPDRTIVLQLRATGPGGMVGDGIVEYPPTHANYAEVLQHLGGLEPGQEKPVPPWPE